MTWGKRRAIVIVIVVLFLAGFFWLVWQPARLAPDSVLVIDADGQINEQQQNDLLHAINGHQPVLHDYLDAIDAAARDPRIAGIVVRVAPLQTGWGKIEEIRSHLIQFQKSGKPSICYLGYDGIGNPEYFLATGCSQIWLVPTVPVGIRGMMAEALFLRGTLDKLKIVPEYYHIAQYKTAANTYTEKKFTPAHKEEVESLLQSIYHEYIAGAAAARKMPPDKFQKLVEQGPLLTSQAVQSGLVDRLAYWDQVQDYFKHGRRKWHPISVEQYRRYVNPPDAGPWIAVVHATGDIVSGSSQNSPTGGFIMGGDTVASELRSARENPAIKAIVLGIDSGGGSVAGSEVIRREVELADGVKPVVASMSDVAASGGYWIAAPARKIVADPDSITGSIGVLIGKFNISGLYTLLGMTTDYVATSNNATIFSDQQSFTPEQQALIQKSLNETYAEFTQGVARGRHMSVHAVDNIAKGRVWSGAQARKIGLVDQLGGLDTAIDVAKELAHIPSSESVRIVRYPQEKTLWQLLIEHEENISASASSSIQSTLQQIIASSGTIQARMPYHLTIR